jgi:hypothetical protein
MDVKYSSSAFLRAQGVRRKNFKLDLILGSLKKQRTGMRSANSRQPYCWTSWVRIISNVIRAGGHSIESWSLPRTFERPIQPAAEYFLP